MHRFRRYALLAWVLTLLLVAGGNLAHAWTDATEPHCHCDGSDPEEHPDSSPAHHTCCHAHSPIAVDASPGPKFGATSRFCEVLAWSSASLPEAPVREIEIPPQLS